MLKWVKEKLGESVSGRVFKVRWKIGAGVEVEC